MGALLGVREVQAALEKVAVGADMAAKLALAEAATSVVRRAQANFSGSHKPGQPHVGGAQPNVVTGNLRRSITMTPITRIGINTYAASVGPTAIYGRSVELGGRHSRAFPYFVPAAQTAAAEFYAIAVKHWSEFLRL